MPVSNRELEALKIIHRYGGQTGTGAVAQVIGVSTDYARAICTGLGNQDYIDLTARGLCTITPKGLNELASRGLIQPSPQGAFQTGGAGAPSYQFPEQRTPPRHAAGPGEMVDVKCGYCWGRGTDPFGCPSPTSKCSVCGGRGYNRVMTPYANCADCGGSGKQPGRRLTCSTCKGKGVMTVREPAANVARSPSFIPTGTPAPQARTATGGNGGRARIGSVRGTLPTAPGTAIRGGVNRAGTSPRALHVTSLAERASAYIASYSGVSAEDVEALLGVSSSQAERILQSLVKAAKVKKRDELYYPA